MNLRMNPFKQTSKWEGYLVIGIGGALILLIVLAAGLWVTEWAWHNFMGSVFGIRDLNNWEAFAFGLLASHFGRPSINWRKKE